MSKCEYTNTTQTHNETTMKRVQVCFSRQENLGLNTSELTLSCVYKIRRGTVVCNVGKSQLLSASYDTHPIALRRPLASQAGALLSKMTSFANLVQSDNAIAIGCKQSSYAMIARQTTCDGYICNPCALGASLELTTRISLADNTRYEPLKLVASVHIFTVDARHRDMLRYCTSQCTQDNSIVDGGHLQILSRLSQHTDVSCHGIMRNNIEGPNYKVMASANELMYVIDWHASFPRREYSLAIMRCIQVAAIKTLILKVKYVFPRKTYIGYTKVPAVSRGWLRARHVAGYP